MTRIFTVDAFAASPFSGNPASVCVLEEERDEQWMQQVAMEMNHSETAFVRRVEGGFALRWFTPTVEVELCGHATLATAHVLWCDGAVEERLRFFTLSGELHATRAGDSIVLDFPAIATAPIELPEGLASALGATPVAVGRCRNDWLVEMDHWKTVVALEPDVMKLCGLEARGVIVTARGGLASDFTSRFFAPAVGVNEDPVTGVAHCALGPYWAGRFNKASLVGYQASSRGGFVGVEVRGDRVAISGPAIIVVRGTIA